MDRIDVLGAQGVDRMDVLGPWDWWIGWTWVKEYEEDGQDRDGDWGVWTGQMFQERRVWIGWMLQDLGIGGQDGLGYRNVVGIEYISLVSPIIILLYSVGKYSLQYSFPNQYIYLRDIHIKDRGWFSCYEVKMAGLRMLLIIYHYILFCYSSC